MTDFMEQSVERLIQRVGTSYFGKYRGTVTAVDDDGCRIKATLQNPLNGEETGWADPVVPFAGDGCGLVMLPPLNSGVWIEFEAGRLDKPLWTGAWWANGQRPEPKGDGVRVLVSENGHKIIFNDQSNELTLLHGALNGGEITLSDEAIVLKMGACEIEISSECISLNQGQIKIGLAGVSLVNGAMSFGVPPP